MRRCKGFSALEYAVLVMIVVSGLIAMSSYLRRSLCGKWRQAADGFGFGRQYDK
jgi:Flp pilus assembly pilin Flp